jgi:hypothetical protein
VHPTAEPGAAGSGGAPPPRPPWAPFCSERCKMVDLGRWLRGDNAIPGEPANIASDEGEA